MRAYLNVSADEKHQLHNKVLVGREVHSSLKRGTEWMNEASMTISKCCDVANIRRGATWVSVDDENFVQVVVTLG